MKSKNPKWEYEVGWSYPSSPNAVTFGFGTTGCWTVSRRKYVGYGWRGLKGFATKPEAEAYLATFIEPLSKSTP